MINDSNGSDHMISFDLFILLFITQLLLKIMLKLMLISLLSIREVLRKGVDSEVIFLSVINLPNPLMNQACSSYKYHIEK